MSKSIIAEQAFLKKIPVMVVTYQGSDTMGNPFTLYVNMKIDVNHEDYDTYTPVFKTTLCGTDTRIPHSLSMLHASDPMFLPRDTVIVKADDVVDWKWFNRMCDLCWEETAKKRLDSYMADISSGAIRFTGYTVKFLGEELPKSELTKSEAAPTEVVYEEIRTKSVLDQDGMLTDYTMYRNQDTGTYVFIFGDSDAYNPDNTDPDYECDTLEEAEEWFSTYNGFDDFEEGCQRKEPTPKEAAEAARASVRERVASRLKK